jgi:hypothetical protein
MPPKAAGGHRCTSAAVSRISRRPTTPRRRRSARHPRGGRIFDASWEQTRLAGELLSRGNALEDAYDARIDAISRATGQRLVNPLRVIPRAPEPS